MAGWFMTVSVMITTTGRIMDLRRTCGVLRQLNPLPLEVLITADGCTERAIEAVKAELPQARLFVNEVGLGSVASRDRMMREAQGDLVLALDDDSYPEQLDCIARFVPHFEQRPNLAVLHFPQRTDEYPETLGQTDFGPERLTRSFANSGAVLRRSIYVQLPGFESRFFHMYEEPDYALQCVAAGYDVLFSPTITIRHHYSGQARDEIRIHHRHARNELWSALMRCPFPFAPVIAGWRVFSQFRYAYKRGLSWLIREPTWWWRALAGIPYCLRKHRPVSWAGYKRWLALR
jgi:GT2 family glycosyltransferase